MSLASRMTDWATTAVVTQLRAEIPNLSEGSAALEEQVMATSDADTLDDAYERARGALV
jgi:hypothetical protein